MGLVLEIDFVVSVSYHEREGTVFPLHQTSITHWFAIGETPPDVTAGFGDGLLLDVLLLVLAVFEEFLHLAGDVLGGVVFDGGSFYE